MSEEKLFTFSTEDKYQSAQGNLISFILVVIKYLQKNELNVRAFWQYVGQQFAMGWTNVEKGDVQGVAQGIALNMASVGSDVQAIQSNSEQVKLIVNGWPTEGFAQNFLVSVKDAAQMVEVFRPIAASLDLSYDWQQEDSTITMTIKG